jgi:F0F1-type ATP synthase delta subunit
MSPAKSIALPDSIYSPDQISAIVADLGDYQTALRDTAVRAKSKTAKTLQAAEPTAPLLAILKAAGLHDPKPDALDDLRRQLEDMLAKSPVAHITLADLPNQTTKKAITAWFRTRVSPTMLVAFSVRPDIGGGAIVRCGSRIYDFSFKHLLIANKQKLAEIAAHV